MLHILFDVFTAAIIGEQSIFFASFKTCKYLKPSWSTLKLFEQKFLKIINICCLDCWAVFKSPFPLSTEILYLINFVIRKLISSVSHHFFLNIVNICCLDCWVLFKFHSPCLLRFYIWWFFSSENWYLLLIMILSW